MTEHETGSVGLGEKRWVYIGIVCEGKGPGWDQFEIPAAIVFLDYVPKVFHTLSDARAGYKAVLMCPVDRDQQLYY